MSVVTGIMLMVGYADELDAQPIAEIQDWLKTRYSGQSLVDVADGTGGWKHPQFYALGAGINHFLDDEEFAAFVVGRAWRAPENVVLIMQPEEGETRVVRPGNF